MNTSRRSIRPLMWSHGGHGSHDDHAIHLDVFSLPDEVYAAMQRQTGSAGSKRGNEINARIGGLGEMLALEVPARPAFFTSRYDSRKGSRTLRLYWPRGLGAQAQPFLSQALTLWFRHAYPMASEDLLCELAAAVERPECWGQAAISPKPGRNNGVCGGPEDPTYYSALTAVVAHHLAGHAVEWPDGSSEPLIPMVPNGDLYKGFELLIGTPKHVEDGRGGIQFSAEVLTLSTATLADQGQLGTRVLARISTRHWIPIAEKGPWFDGKFKHRSLDVVRNPGADPSHPPGWHTSLRFTAELAEDDLGHSPWKADNTHPVRANWANTYAAGVMQRLLDFQPGEFPRNSANGHMMPGYSETAGAWVLPRFASSAGDRDAADGTGVGFPDRRDVMRSLDGPLSALDLVLSEPFERPTRPRSPVRSVVKKRLGEGELNDQFLEAISRAAKAAGSAASLDFVAMAVRESTTKEICGAITALTGVSWRQTDAGIWESDGHPFKLRVKGIKSGPFSPSPRGGGNAGTGRAPSVQTLGDHFDQACDGLTPTFAIVEMDRRLRGRKMDPYKNAYKALQRRGVLPQAVLSDVDEENGHATTKERTAASAAARKGKIKHAVLDCLRMLGVVVVHDEDLKDIAVAGLSMVGSRPWVKDVPVAVLATASGLRAARWRTGPEGSARGVEWVPYGKFLLGMRNGEVARAALPRGPETKSQRVQRVEAFMEAVLSDLNGRFEKCLVMVDGVRVREYFPAMSNDRLMFDRIGFGADASQWQMTPETSLRNLAIVRVVHEGGKVPQYFPLEYEEDALATSRRWPQGAYFSPQGERVGYALIAEPTTRHRDSSENVRSRHRPGDNASHKSRAASAMVEMALVSRPEWVEDPRMPIIRSVRLRGLNVQYLDNDTTLPFPLHEAELLGEK